MFDGGTLVFDSSNGAIPIKDLTFGSRILAITPHGIDWSRVISVYIKEKNTVMMRVNFDQKTLAYCSPYQGFVMDYCVGYTSHLKSIQEVHSNETYGKIRRIYAAFMTPNTEILGTQSMDDKVVHEAFRTWKCYETSYKHFYPIEVTPLKIRDDGWHVITEDRNFAICLESHTTINDKKKVYSSIFASCKDG